MDERDGLGMTSGDISLETANTTSVMSRSAANASSGSINNMSYMQPKKQKSGKETSLT
jgi:hypothetical protein